MLTLLLPFCAENQDSLLPSDGLGNQNKDKHSVGFYRHFKNSGTGKILGLGKGNAKMAKHPCCPPESSHLMRKPDGKTTAKHSRIFFFFTAELGVCEHSTRLKDSPLERGCDLPCNDHRPYHSKQDSRSNITQGLRRDADTSLPALTS